MEPSYSHSSEDSIHSSFSYSDLYSSPSPAQDPLDLSPSQSHSPFEPSFDSLYGLSPPSQYAFPELFPVVATTPNTSYAVPTPTSGPQYYDPSSAWLSTSASSAAASAPLSLSPSSPPLQWTPSNESFIPNFAPVVGDSPPETSSPK